MPSSPWPPTAGVRPPLPAQGTVSTEARERYYFQGSRAPPSQQQGSVDAAISAKKPMAWPPSADYFSEVKAQEHGEKINKYQSMLAARLKAKYFSNNTFGKGDVFEEIVIQSETIRLSRWPFTSLFADPAKFCREKSYTECKTPPGWEGQLLKCSTLLYFPVVSSCYKESSMATTARHRMVHWCFFHRRLV
ncbi:hypothetical protein U9M48_038474 [Paspalum notatum var. saurae]|uniref:Uncharacterized protein n=1 Tax=Paspalum notatum var. saurae TaxID=547442 RepID=A0AAQ3UIL1_PASNO